jgi:hypothetical protein
LHRIRRDEANLRLIVAKWARDQQTILREKYGALGSHEKAGIKPGLMQAPAEIATQGARA